MPQKNQITKYHQKNKSILMFWWDLVSAEGGLCFGGEKIKT